MKAEFTNVLNYEKYSPEGHGTGNSYSAATVSNITDVALEEIKQWHSRTLKKRYSVIYIYLFISNSDEIPYPVILCISYWVLMKMATVKYLTSSLSV